MTDCNDEKPWYLGAGPEARAERVRRGLETSGGAITALSAWEAAREPGGECHEGTA